MPITKKIACINDFTGFGRCSLSVALPVISVCGVQCCPFPTAVFSNHTGFESFFEHDLTDVFMPFADEWEKLALRFDGIYTGYLASGRQISLVESFFDRFTDTDTIVIIDPVMGDGGRLYKNFDETTVSGMKRLAERADILTPNLTEACLLAGTEINLSPDEEFLKKLAKVIPGKASRKLVITGIECGSILRNYVLTPTNGGVFIDVQKTAPTRSGTGDVFASIIAAAAVRDMDFEKSVRLASDFIKQAAEAAYKQNIPETDGAVFEPFLYKLGEHFA
jgi:pyridoxine kinase